MSDWEALSKDEQMERATEAQARYTDMLMRMENVTGVAVGLITKDNSYTDQIGLVVLVEKKVPSEQLAPQDRIPDELDGVPVDVQEVGKVIAF